MGQSIKHRMKNALVFADDAYTASSLFLPVFRAGGAPSGHMPGVKRMTEPSFWYGQTVDPGCAAGNGGRYRPINQAAIDGAGTNRRI